MLGLEIVMMVELVGVLYYMAVVVLQLVGVEIVISGEQGEYCLDVCKVCM